MRRDRFLEAFAEHLPYLRQVAKHSGIGHDAASEVLGKCSEMWLKNKSYSSIETEDLKSFLGASVRYEIKHYQQEETRSKINCARLPDPELDFHADSYLTAMSVVELDPIEETECPFCFSANLNEYGACHMCHTIVPSHRRIQRNVIVMTKESLAVQFDFDTKLDVQKAISQLTPYEQKLVWAIGIGNESLESFAELVNSYPMSISRDWVEVKAKLQGYLNEYAPESLSKRGANAFRRALQSIEKPQ